MPIDNVRFGLSDRQSVVYKEAHPFLNIYFYNKLWMYIRFHYINIFHAFIFTSKVINKHAWWIQNNIGCFFKVSSNHKNALLGYWFIYLGFGKDRRDTHWGQEYYRWYPGY